MDKDRVKGAATQAKGAIKEAAGKLTGDEKLKAEGAADKVAGKMQKAVGGAKDKVREEVKKGDGPIVNDKRAAAARLLPTS